MNTESHIRTYIASHPETKRNDLQALHDMIRNSHPGCKLWYLDGRNEAGKMVSNPNIGYGQLEMKYADGKTREFYRVGVSANTTGISVYIMGLDDKTYLASTYGKDLGRASVTGYCIRFKNLKDINLEVLKSAILDGFSPSPRR